MKNTLKLFLTLICLATSLVTLSSEQNQYKCASQEEFEARMRDAFNSTFNGRHLSFNIALSLATNNPDKKVNFDLHDAQLRCGLWSHHYAPLQASCNGQAPLDLLKALIKAKANLNEVNISGETALHGAARNNFVDHMHILLRSGTHVNAVNLKGETPLMEAARYEHIHAIQVLLEYGARKYLINSAGKTAYDLRTSQATYTAHSDRKDYQQYVDLLKIATDDPAFVQRRAELEQERHLLKASVKKT